LRTKELFMFSHARVALLAAAFGMSGCGATIPQLRTRASVDMSCTAESLHVQPLDDATQIVSGCGKRAVYVELFNNARAPTWLLNSSIDDVGVPPDARSTR
jgi:hypothetical protein